MSSVLAKHLKKEVASLRDQQHIVVAAIDRLDFNPSMQQLGQNVLPVFDSLVFF